MDIVTLDKFISDAKGGMPFNNAFEPRYLQRLKFLEKNWSVPPDKPFSTKGRDWLFEQFRAFDGFKAWPVNSEYLCSECVSKIDEVIDHPLEVAYTRSEEHRIANGGCLGLKHSNIYYHVFDADRRAGKTSTTFGYMGSLFYLDHNVRIHFTASSKEHSLELGEKNFFNAIKRNPDLNKSFVNIWETDGTCRHRKRNNDITFGSASDAANLGGGYELLVFDECKKIKLKIIAALSPTINENYGIRCMTCNYKKHGGKTDYTDLNFDWKCPVCKTSLLVPWNARMLFSSNAKVLDGDIESDWYPILVESLLNEPFEHAHMLKENNAANLNPDYNEEAKAATVQLLGRIPGAEHYIAAELGNENTLPGNTVFSEVEQAALFAKKLENEPTKEPVFFYLDLARKVDKVNLLGFKDASVKKDWSYLRNVHLSLWSPNKDTVIASPTDDGSLALDEDKLVEVVHRILEDYPNFIYCWVDIRGHEWAKDVLKKLKVGIHAHKFLPFEGNDQERDLGWGIFYDRTAARLLDLIWHERYTTEFNQAIWHKTQRKLVVRERSKGKSATSRDKFHLELTESVASAHFISTILKDMPKSLTEHQRIVQEAIKGRKKRAHNFGDEITGLARRKYGGKFGSDSF